MRKNILLTLIVFCIVSISTSLIGQEFKFKKKLNKYIYKPSDGKLDYNKQYDEVISHFDGTWKVRNEDNWGMVNNNGEIIIEVKYEQVDWLINGNSIIRKDGKYGVVNKERKEILAPEFDRIDYYEEKGSLVQKEGVWGIIKDGHFSERKEEIVYRNPDVKPMLKECIGKEDNCTLQEMLNTVYQNIRYPDEAIKKGIEGIVVTEIIIGEEGNLEEVNILKGIGGGCDTEATRIIKTYLTEWEAGKQEGRVVKSRIIFPIKYQLE